MANTPAQGSTKSTGMGSGTTTSPMEARDGPHEPARTQRASNTSASRGVAASRPPATSLLDMPGPVNQAPWMQLGNEDARGNGRIGSHHSLRLFIVRRLEDRGPTGVVRERSPRLE